MDPELRQFLIRSDLANPHSKIIVSALPGGVSCDVWKVDGGGHTFVVKRALPRLRVAKVWEAPIARSEAEWNWLNFARGVVPNSVPRALAQEPEAGMIAIEYLEPEQYPVWKKQLFDGIIDANIAAATARTIVRIHAASAGNLAVASRFRTRESFHALRIEPYLLEAARQNPSVSVALNRLAEETLQTEVALVHGDLSPKNILVGSDGPVILDAETAWYGDPAFDVAFCLNHLLLKCVARPNFAAAYLRSFDAFREAYLSAVTWEPCGGVERRTAQLLPALMLARVDGKSPVEYFNEAQRSLVRDSAIAMIGRSFTRLLKIAGVWKTKVMPPHYGSKRREAG